MTGAEYNWLIASISFYLCVAIWVIADLFRRRASLVEPACAFIFFLSLFTLPLPIRLLFTMEIEGTISPYLLDFAPYVPASVLASGIALATFYVTYRLPLGARLATAVPMIQTRSSKGAAVGAAVVALTALGLLSMLAGGVANLGSFLLLGYGSTAETFGVGFLAVGFPWLGVAALLYWVAFAISRNWLWFGLGLAALILVLAMHFVMGSRSMMMYLLIAFGVFFMLKIRTLGWKTLLLLGLAGFLALNVIGHTRQSSYASFGDFVRTTAESAAYSFSQSNEALFYTLTEGEFVVPFETLPQTIRTVGISIPPWLGASYARSPLFLIPSVLYPDRPAPLSHWYMQTFYGQEGRQNEGRGFFFLAEAYLNFGALGIVLIAAIWGLAWRAFYEWLRATDFDAGAAFIYSLGLAYMFRMIAGNAETIVAGFTQQSLAAAILGLLFARVALRWRKTPGMTVSQQMNS